MRSRIMIVNLSLTASPLPGCSSRSYYTVCYFLHVFLEGEFVVFPSSQVFNLGPSSDLFSIYHYADVWSTSSVSLLKDHECALSFSGLGLHDYLRFDTPFFSRVDIPLDSTNLSACMLRLKCYRRVIQLYQESGSRQNDI